MFKYVYFKPSTEKDIHLRVLEKLNLQLSVFMNVGLRLNVSLNINIAVYIWHYYSAFSP